MGNRENLIRLTKGDTKRTNIFLISFGEKPQFDENQVEETELRKLSSDGFLMMFSSSPDERGKILRENRCLVRGSDGRFTAHNFDKTGAVYLVN